MLASAGALAAVVIILVMSKETRAGTPVTLAGEAAEVGGNSSALPAALSDPARRIDTVIAANHVSCVLDMVLAGVRTYLQPRVRDVHLLVPSRLRTACNDAHDQLHVHCHDERVLLNISDSELGAVLARKGGDWLEVAASSRRLWYFAQLLKLTAALTLPTLSDEFLVLDSDYVLLRPFSLFVGRRQGVKRVRLEFVSPAAYAKPYAAATQALLGVSPPRSSNVVSHKAYVIKSEHLKMLGVVCGTSLDARTCALAFLDAVPASSYAHQGMAECVCCAGRARARRGDGEECWLSRAAAHRPSPCRAAPCSAHARAPLLRSTMFSSSVPSRCALRRAAAIWRRYEMMWTWLLRTRPGWVTRAQFSFVRTPPREKLPAAPAGCNVSEGMAALDAKMSQMVSSNKYLRRPVQQKEIRALVVETLPASANETTRKSSVSSLARTRRSLAAAAVADRVRHSRPRGRGHGRPQRLGLRGG